MLKISFLLEERESIEAALNEIEQQLKSTLLFALEESSFGSVFPLQEVAFEAHWSVAETAPPNLQESISKIDSETKEAHRTFHKLCKNTKTVASRFRVGE